MTDCKSISRERFGAFAQTYVTSATHASGPDLERLLALADPQPEWLALDLATGGGHTALQIAPRVRALIAADLALPMLEAARSHAAARGVAGIDYVAADAEALPFPNAAFDLITCRIAAHHFPDAFAFMRECARVLRPGGRLVIQDHVNPDDRAAAAWLDSFERLRDPGHHRIYSEAEWRGLFLDVDLVIDQVEMLRRTAHLLTWAAAQACPLEVIIRLQVLLKQAPRRAAEWIRPRCVGTDDASFDHVYILLSGHKPC